MGAVVYVGGSSAWQEDGRERKKGKTTSPYNTQQLLKTALTKEGRGRALHTDLLCVWSSMVASMLNPSNVPSRHRKPFARLGQQMTSVGHVGSAYRSAGDFTVELEGACVTTAASPVLSYKSGEARHAFIPQPTQEKRYGQWPDLRRTEHPTPWKEESANGTKAESRCLLPRGLSEDDRQLTTGTRTLRDCRLLPHSLVHRSSDLLDL